jgi:hypothetical protein
MSIAGKPEAMGYWLPKLHGAHPMRQNPNVERAIRLALHQATEYEHQVKKEPVTMPKILKKFEHKAKIRQGAFASKYDWTLYLSGQNVQLTCGEDFPTATDEEEAAYVVEQQADAAKGSKTLKDVKSLREVRKTNFITTLKSRGHDEGKTVLVTELDDGDLVVTATKMTAEQIAERNAELERRRKDREAKKATTNGQQTHLPVAEAAVAPE